jgi:hypothetical protein
MGTNLLLRKRSSFRSKSSKFIFKILNSFFSSMLTWLEEIKKKSVTFLKTDKIILNLKLYER